MQKSSYLLLILLSAAKLFSTSAKRKCSSAEYPSAPISLRSNRLETV